MKTQMIRNVAGGAALLASLAAGSLGAQQADNRWMAFLGCWEADAATAGAPMLCVLPHTGGAGVDMVTVTNGREESREWVSADGTMQESSREGCRGWERARFSEDQRRLYLDSDHTCDGGGRQEASGMLAMVSQDEWVDIRTVKVAGQQATGVIRYKLAPADDAQAAGFGDIAADRAMAVRTARMQAASVLTIDDVIDASRFVDAEVARTWIAERREPFRLDKARLVRMADAGVPTAVIDVVVAVSYPDVFQLGQGAQATKIEDPDVGVAGGPDPYYGVGRRGPFWDPRIGGYNPGYGYGTQYGGYYGYGPRGRFAYGGYGYPGYYEPTIVIVEPAGSNGRVVNGRGYTKGTTTTSSSKPSSSPAPSTSSTPSSSSGTATSTPSPSTGTSTGRTAQPRPPEP